MPFPHGFLTIYITKLTEICGTKESDKYKAEDTWDSYAKSEF